MTTAPSRSTPWTQSWIVALAFLVGFLFMLPSKGFPGPWIPLFDDGAWLAMVRHWCGGARLYTEVIDLKPPGFFLYLKPLCLIPQSPNLTMTWEPFAFWLPIIVGYSFGLHLIAKAMVLDTLGSVVLGFLASALVFTNRSESFFASEHPAACFVFLAAALVFQVRKLPQDRRRWTSAIVALLIAAGTLCNTKFVAFAPLYFFMGDVSWREFWRDFLLSVALAIGVTLATIGWHPETFRWLAQISQKYWEKPLAERIQDLLLLGFFDAKFGLFAPLQLAFSWIVPEGLAQLFSQWLGLTAVGAFCVYLMAKLRYLALPLFASLAAIVAVGSIWTHTLIQIVPVLILGAAELIDRWRGRTHIAMLALFFIFSNLSVDFDLVHSRLAKKGQANALFSSASSPAFREGHILTSTFQKHIGEKPWFSLLGNGMPLWLTPGAQRPLNGQYHNYCWAAYPWMEKDITNKMALGEPFFLVSHTYLATSACATQRLFKMLEPICTSLQIVPSAWISSVEFFACYPAPFAMPLPMNKIRRKFSKILY